MLSLRVDPGFQGPTIIEMEPVIAMNPNKLLLRWTNTRPETDVLRRYPEHDFDLIVPNQTVMERSACSLGLPFTPDPASTVEALNSFADPEGRWREYATRTGAQVARSRMISAVANSLRAGRLDGTRDLRKVLVESLLDHTSPIDLDTLVGLRRSGADV